MVCYGTGIISKTLFSVLQSASNSQNVYEILLLLLLLLPDLLPKIAAHLIANLLIIYHSKVHPSYQLFNAEKVSLEVAGLTVQYSGIENLTTTKIRNTSIPVEVLHSFQQKLHFLQYASLLAPLSLFWHCKAP